MSSCRLSSILAVSLVNGFDPEVQGEMVTHVELQGLEDDPYSVVNGHPYA
jgi:hypothetical protein